MIELLSPAGSPEALRAAVQNGADAVYLGCGSFNARANAKNFTPDSLREAVSYCHIRGVKVHLTLNTLTTDREQSQVAELIRQAARAGVDAFIVQDPGTVRLCRAIAPRVAVHASTQMSIHSLDGVRQAAKLGCSRVVLARELPEEDIAYICRHSPVEIEVFVHGALCMCYSGQCYFSSVVGRRSGNRGQCAQPCRLPYGYGRQEEKYPLSLKDNCLISRLSRLQALGVASLKLEGRMKRPEYVATVTRIYRSALDVGQVTEENRRELEQVFSRQGFTQGFYEGRPGGHMLGTRQELREDKALLAAARASYENGERPRVPLRFYALIRRDQPVLLAAEDPEGRRCKVEGPVPEAARTRPLDAAELESRLAKTGGTPYRLEALKCAIDPGLSLSAAAVNSLRRELLNQLTMLRGRSPGAELFAPPPVSRQAGPDKKPALTVSVMTAGQVTDALLALNPRVLYVPLSVLKKEPTLLRRVPQGTELCPIVPRVIPDRQQQEVEADLIRLKQAGIRSVLCGNTGHIAMVQRLGLRARGDFGLNVFSSAAMDHWKEEGLRSVTVSFEATLPQIRDLSKPLPCELLAYGRLPLMLTENCLIRNRTGVCACTGAVTRLIDRKGEEFPVLPDPGTCRSVVYNGKKLYLLDKQEELSRLGLWALRLQFTTENPQGVDRVLGQYARGAEFNGEACTRGLYYRGVE